jgi:bacterioferritin
MKGDSKVIDTLNGLLAGELAARDQYFIHSRMYEDMGLVRLYQRIGHEMEDETGHADMIIKRILLLEGVPTIGEVAPLRIGATVREMLENDLALEVETQAKLKAAIRVCEEAQDYQTRAELVTQLADTEEDHAHWLEQQLGLMAQMGEKNYLQLMATPPTG